MDKIGRKKYGREGFYFPRLLPNSTAFFKTKAGAKMFARDVGGKLRLTKHASRGKGYLVYK